MTPKKQNSDQDCAGYRHGTYIRSRDRYSGMTHPTACACKTRQGEPRFTAAGQIRNSIPAKALLIFIAAIYIIPVLIIFTNSFMSQGEIARNYSAEYDLFDYELRDRIHYAEYSLIPDNITLEQYNTLLFKTPVYLDLFINSLRLTLPIVLMQVAIGSLAAYGFTVWKLRYKEIIFCVYIIVMVLPFQATLVSNYIMADSLGILNTRLSIILPWGFSPFAVFIMRQCMKGIPYSVFEAAQIDGAGHIRRFFHIALPLSKAGIAALVILSFADAWAMVEHPMIFLKDLSMEPLSVMLFRIGQENMGLIFAASVFYMLPVVWIFLYGQEHLEHGVRLSALR
ncbi:MAG: carbohydrate ABC transporter permease [Synergistaceae bacterium]|nr:carbohydrate ABC transporter permease [Synergistaceae bacterium]